LSVLGDNFEHQSQAHNDQYPEDDYFPKGKAVHLGGGAHRAHVVSFTDSVGEFHPAKVTRIFDSYGSDSRVWVLGAIASADEIADTRCDVFAERWESTKP
jgi:hypothetical protein